MLNRKSIAFSVIYGLFGLILLAPLPAYAACVLPPGQEGAIIYNADFNVPQVCVGSQWVALGVLNPSAGGGGCSNPSGVEGEAVYNAEFHVPQYCDGDDWRSMLGWYDLDGCAIGSAFGSGICGGHRDGKNIIVTPAGCSAGADDPSDCTGNDAGTDAYQNYAYNGNYDVANKHMLDDSISATDQLLADAGDYSIADYCRSITIDGRTWHAPSVADLVTLFVNRNVGDWTNGAFSQDDIYWAANEASINNAYTINFSSAASDHLLDYDNSSWTDNYARCVSFSDIVPTSAESPASGCPNIGDVCSDGSVYAGISPDGSVPMYTSRCDFGQTWNGSACTGEIWELTWNNANGVGNNTTGTTSSTDGDGNTASLVASTNAGYVPYVAAVTCDNLVVHGKSDWHLPARNELLGLYNNRAAIGGFSTNYYWSSSESTALDAYYRDFSSGSSGAMLKANRTQIRCVRLQP